MSAAEIAKRAAGLHEAIGADLAGFGGFLRCEECGYRQELEAPAHGHYLRRGWPKHCGYTMRWWTQRQIDAGEVPESVREGTA